VFLPRLAGGERASAPEQRTDPTPRGSETILVVEDDRTLRDLVTRVLRDLGYAVLQAPSGGEALELARTWKGDIHLVLTDVVMPGMGGPTLVENVKLLRPEARVLFMSGYAPQAAVFERHGAALLLNKPFTPRGLALKVREVLDSPLPPG